MTNTPVISKNDAFLYQSVLNRMHEVAADIQKEILPADRVDVYGGKPGIALASAWMGYWFPEQNYSDYAFELLNGLIDNIGTIQWSPDMGCELAGCAFVLQQLQNKGIVDEEDDLGLEAVDEFLLSSAPFYAEHKNWDPLLGITPIGIYFLERHKTTRNKEPLELITKLIDGLSTKHEGYDVWITPGHRFQPKDCLNFGMAHGMPGLISFLSQVYAAGINTTIIAPKVNSCIQYLLSCQNPAGEHSQFPSYLFPVENDADAGMSRLGWCYGDLGMAFALIHWGKASQQPSLVEKGIQIGLETTKRTTETAACTDAPICHGSAGLMHQYTRLYQFTGNDEFKRAAHQWATATLETFYLPGKGVGGYPFMTFNEEMGVTEPTSSPSLLEGAAGVALVMASSLFAEAPSWDALFLTNIE
jgi:lantibiotic biosynthesis protein